MITDSSEYKQQYHQQKPTAQATAATGMSLPAVPVLQQKEAEKPAPRFVVQRKNDVGFSSDAGIVQRVKDINPDAKVKIVSLRPELSFKEGIVIGISKGHGDNAYEVNLNGETEIIDQIYVFPHEQSDEEILLSLAPLDDAIKINNEFDNGGLKKFNEQTLTEELFAPRKLLDIRRKAKPEGNVTEAVKSAVTWASELLSLHPFKNGNGRTALFYIYQDLAKSNLYLAMSPLDLHGITLGEDQNTPLEKNPGKVMGIIESKCKTIPEEFDTEAFLSTCLADLKTLEADREIKQQEKEKERMRLVEQREKEEEEEKQENAANACLRLSDYTEAIEKAPSFVQKALQKLQEAALIFREDMEGGHKFMTISVNKIKQFTWDEFKDLCVLNKEEDEDEKEALAFLTWLDSNFDMEGVLGEFDFKDDDDE